jgi:5-methylthioadenosine/S-adenosylhomocysteine deaminase
MYEPVSHLVYAARGGDVRHVMVGGRWVVRARQLLTFELAPVMAEARAVAVHIQGRA